MTYQAGRLSALLLTVFDEYLDGPATRPWSDLADELAEAVVDGQVTLERAARIDHLLRMTLGAEVSSCGTCSCPVVGLTHQEHA